jgi:DNA helicase-2/ATP-dependent DNA helicase PcrA
MTAHPDTPNTEQEKAISHLGGPLLIIAGAGTGKTRVITERVAFLLDNITGLRPENIVALTFTDRATEEMSTRIRRRLAMDDDGSVCVRTFHSFALKLVQEQAVLLHRDRETQLLDNFDFWVLLRRQIEKLQLEVFWKNAEPGKFLKDLIDFMSRAHDELVSVEDYEAYVRQLETDLQSGLQSGLKTQLEVEEQLKREREIARVYRIATELLAEAGAQTYGDVIATAVRLLKAHPDVCAEYQGRYRALLVDEFQDTNVAQIELLELLARSHRNITVVGDDDQGIYRFRGASSESFNMFARKFDPYRQLKLTQNYRSTQRILRIANQLITVNQDRFDAEKNLWTENEQGEHVRLMQASTSDDEALAIAAEIDGLHQSGRPLRDMAVLYRAHAHRDLLIKALRRRSIPFQVVGLSVMEKPAVRDLMAAAHFVAHLHDNIACARIISHPRWRFTEEDLVTLSHRTSSHPRRDPSGRPSLYEVLQEAAQLRGETELKAKVTGVVEWVESIRKAIPKRTAAAAMKILAVELMQPVHEPQTKLGDISGFRMESVEKPVRLVLEFVEGWQKKNPKGTLKDFLQYFEFYLEAGGGIAENEKENVAGDAVRLMTVHAAKGLEFPVVFVLRLTQNYFPSKRRTSLLPFPQKLRKEGALPPSDTHTYEERRLCYVAFTRPKALLILSSVVKPRWKPSEFLADIQRDKRIAARDLVMIPVAASGEDLINELALDPLLDDASLATSRLPLWALRNAPLPGEHTRDTVYLKLSASSMEGYKSCPLQYKFDHEYKLTGAPTAALSVGAVLHECVRQFFVLRKQQADFSWKDMEEFFAGRWRRAGFEDDYQEQRYRKDALNQLQAFYGKNIDIEVEILAQEKSFEFQIGGLTVIGRIDQMSEGPDGAVELIDYKTGSPRDQQDADKSLQLSVYALACREAFHRPAPLLSFYNLQSGEKVVTDRTDAQLELDRAMMVQMAAGIRQRQFFPQKGYHCRYCDFHPLCPAWEEV